jgi:molybdopterin-guanine dinucleotide biosynthesis protein
MQATLQANSYAKHHKNTRVYVVKALASTFHVRKEGRGRRCIKNGPAKGTLTVSKTRFVATEQTARGRIVAAPSLHELLAKLNVGEQLMVARSSLGIFN